MEDFKNMTVGQIVAHNILTADILSRFGIDFCTDGGDNLVNAVEKTGANIDMVIEELKKVKPVSPDAIDFKAWPLDLICDYILKIYHRNIRIKGPEIQSLLDKVCKVDGESHPSLFEVQELFEVSMLDLEHHLQKEEQILFPYIYALYDAKMSDALMPRFHCGSVANPIEVMKIEHGAECERYRHIEDLTGGYSAPEDSSNNYKKVMKDMKELNKALHLHIHLENNIVFPAAIKIYDELARKAVE